ncbi:MAG: GatB/YqeY domain-containing protein [Candidatus Paceibacterota bacterium]
MSLQQQIKDDLKASMREKNAVKVSVLRNITSEITNQLLKEGQTPQGALADESVQNVIERLAKQRRESVQQYEQNDRPEAALQEKQELEVLEAYLPEKMSEDEVRVIVIEKIKETGASSPSDIGKVMGPIMQALKGKADGETVKKVVTEELSA